MSGFDATPNFVSSYANIINLTINNDNNIHRSEAQQIKQSETNINRQIQKSFSSYKSNKVSICVYLRISGTHGLIWFSLTFWFQGRFFYKLEEGTSNFLIEITHENKPLPHCLKILLLAFIAIITLSLETPKGVVSSFEIKS